MSLQGIFGPMVRAYFKNKYGGGGEADHSMEDGLITGTITEYRNDRVESVGDYALQYNKLTRITLPNVKTVGSGAFYNASNLKILDLWNVTTIYSTSIEGCNALEHLVFRSETVLDIISIVSASPNYDLIVPRALVNEYLANRTDPDLGFQLTDIEVYALEDYTVDGTVTGELDLTKLEL